MVTNNTFFFFTVNAKLVLEIIIMYVVVFFIYFIAIIYQCLLTLDRKVLVVQFYRMGGWVVDETALRKEARICSI